MQYIIALPLQVALHPLEDLLFPSLPKRIERETKRNRLLSLDPAFNVFFP